ncbi:MAG: SpoIIE family protein phosphatase [bacterium]|nr:SpoIIE family protein phosphatase [bacterium]
MAGKKKIRKVRFGIRFKFSVIMMAGIFFASVLIALAVFKQHERKIKSSMLKQGAIVLKGAVDPSEKYLKIRHFLNSEEAKELSPEQRNAKYKSLQESFKGITGYFSSLGKKVDILDIAFLIDTHWGGLNKPEYIYFERYHNAVKARYKNDSRLSPSIYSHYKKSIDTNASYHTVDENEKTFVLVGMPIFQKKTDVRLYEYYTEFKNTSLSSLNAAMSDYYTIQFNRYNKKYWWKKNKNKNKKKKSAKVRLTLQDYLAAKDKNQKTFKQIFLTRLIDQGKNLDYEIILDTEKKQKTLYYYTIPKLDITHLKKEQLQNLLKEFVKRTGKEISGNRLPIKKLKKIVTRLQKKYGIAWKPKKEMKELWYNFYTAVLRNKKIEITAAKSLEELALASYQQDLAGILGLFLHRHKFFAKVEDDRSEIINLIISILLRCMVIALFLPTFLIRSISTLADGAFEIGKGNLDKKIELKGTDEIGRLADIFNAMTGNLKKAQSEMLIKQRMEEELKTAEQIQATLLPEQLPEVKGIEFGAFYSAQTESGGDYYDVIDLGNKSLGITVADVSGHGVGSGLVMAMTRTLLHTYCKKTANSKKILEIINDYLYENTASNYFVTMFYGVLNLATLKLNYTSAGHNQGILLRKNNLKELPGGGIALGAASNATFTPLADIKELQLQKGDYFIQATDGIDEAMDADNNEFGLERFHKALMENYGKSSQEMVDGVIKKVNKFTGKTPQHDDVTIIILRVL